MAKLPITQPAAAAPPAILSPIEPPPQQQIVTQTAFNPENGQIRYVATGNEGTIIFETTADIGWIIGEWDGSTHYVLDGAPAERPATGLPTTHTLAAGADWSVADVPEGTEVLVDGDVAGAVDATGLVLNFGLAGVWRVDLRPPFPWLVASCEVTVV